MSIPTDTQEYHSESGAPVEPRRASGEAAVRWALVGLLMLMVVGLAFGLGFGTRVVLDRGESSPAQVKSDGVIREDGSPDFRVLDDIYARLRDFYVDPDAINASLLRTGAINGLITAVGDTHQVYLTKTQAELDDIDLKGQFEGIGASVDQRGGEITIVRPFDDSPAKAAGIRPGDVILQIDGQSTKGLTDKDAVRKIRGKQGTTVRLQVRHSDGKVEDLSIVRDAIKVASVKPDKPNDFAGNVAEDIAYVRIEQFTNRTPDELKEYLRTLQGKNYKGLIVDLRNNPGGLLSSVEAVGTQFMKNQTLLIEQRRGGSEQATKTKDGGLAIDPNLKIAVLVNQNSASASEILAGAIRDNQRGVVFGQTTLGKGTVNRFFPLDTDGGQVYVTVGRWLTPKRDQIDGRGIKPDIEVSAADNEDPQAYYNSVMYRAVEWVRTGS